MMKEEEEKKKTNLNDTTFAKGFVTIMIIWLVEW